MSFNESDLLDATSRHGTVARVVVAAVAGSTPRETGAAMLVWHGGQSGTIGGGALEFDATENARRLLTETGQTVSRHPLGPSLGQCCGGTVTLVTEIWDADRINALPEGPVARLVEGARAIPMSVRRAIRQARSSGIEPDIDLDAGWFIEPRQRETRDLWIYGAGHVGQALIAVLAPMPDWSITWVDTTPARFPDTIPAQITQLVAATPARAVPHAPEQADHLILTYSHALDLEICHALLGRSFSSVGLIGSKTKWARFRKRLIALGHAPGHVARISCPIGDPSLGKHPHAIALGVASQLLRRDSAIGTEVHTA